MLTKCWMRGRTSNTKGEHWMVGPLLGLSFAYVMKFQQLTDEIRNETLIGPMGTGRKRSPSTNQRVQVRRIQGPESSHHPVTQSLSHSVTQSRTRHPPPATCWKFGWKAEEVQRLAAGGYSETSQLESRHPRATSVPALRCVGVGVEPAVQLFPNLRLGPALDIRQSPSLRTLDDRTSLRASASEADSRDSER